jgi:hypothetical protein
VTFQYNFENAASAAADNRRTPVEKNALAQICASAITAIFPVAYSL